MGGFGGCLGFSCGNMLLPWCHMCWGWRKSGTKFDSRSWLHKDCCGLACATITYFLISAAGYAALTLRRGVGPALVARCHSVDTHRKITPAHAEQRATNARSRLLATRYIGTRHLIHPWMGVTTLQGLLHTVVLNALLSMGFLCQYRAMTADPGTVPKDAMPLPAYLEAVRQSKGKLEVRKCTRTGVFKPPRAHFDSELQRCVVKMDHHCPWVNNCVGIGNHKFFIQFVMYICLASGFVLTMLVRHYLSCSGFRRIVRQHRHISSDVFATDHPEIPPHCLSNEDSATQSVMRLMLLMEACMFGLFTGIMFCDQVGNVAMNETYIDRIKARRGVASKGDGGAEDVPEAMASKLSYESKKVYFWEWFLPTRPSWSNWEDIMGFRIPELDKRSGGESPDGDRWFLPCQRHVAAGAQKRSPGGGRLKAFTAAV